MRLLKLSLILFILLLVFTVLVVAFGPFNETTQTKNSVSQVNESAGGSNKRITGTSPPYLVDGFDWSLPPNSNVELRSGLIDEYNSGLKFASNKFKILRWDKINPQFGSYDFSEFDTFLEKNKNKKIVVRLEVNSFCEAPKWAFKKLRFSKHKSLIFWDKAYINAIKPLIEKFANRYASNFQIVGLHLGIGDGEYNNSCDYDNKDGWGEFWMSPEELLEAQSVFGLTPEIFEKRTIEIINVYLNAFKKNSSKLAFTNIGSLYSYGTKEADPYNKSLLRISKYILENGIGNRDGEIEIWLRYLDKIYGQKLVSENDGTCKLEMDETYAEMIAGRYWGSENEFYGKKDYVIQELGPYKNQPYRFLISSLRTLQMRRNYFSVSGQDFIELDDPVYRTQEFLTYLTKVMGKQKHNTPDAFILLGERYISADRAKDHSNETCVKGKEKIAIRSFGRWLTESSESQPSIKIKMPKSENYWAQDFYLPDGIDYEYAARSSNKFKFDLNDELSSKRCENGCDAEIKVVFKDSTKTSLLVRIAEGITSTIQTLGDDKIKTATYKVTSKFANGISSKIAKGYDFTIETSGASLPVMLVRVNLL